MDTTPATDAIELHERLASHWEGKYARRSFQGREAILAKCVEGVPLRGQHWLDAGCGTGRLARFLATQGCSVLGVDAARSMIEVAAAEAAAAGLTDRLKFEHIGNIEQMHFAPDAFDGVLCISVLEYLQNPAAAIARCRECVRPDGLFVVAVPNRLSLVRRLLRASFSLRKAITGSGRPTYLEFSRNEYSQDEFADILAAHGFEVSKATYFGGPLPLALQRLSAVGSLIMFVARRT
jgi:2-polyprenyl-6-hydroxyphenyl methylase/3-demethylubiquinone-9 3-methyltransferase